MCLPCATASSTTCAPNSTEPVSVDEHVDLLGAAEQRTRRRSRRCGRRAIASSTSAWLDATTASLEPGVLADAQRLLEPARVDRGHAHAGDAVGDLVGETLRHEAGADQRDPDRPALAPRAGAARCRR